MRDKMPYTVKIVLALHILVLSCLMPDVCIFVYIIYTMWTSSILHVASRNDFILLPYWHHITFIQHKYSTRTTCIYIIYNKETVCLAKRSSDAYCFRFTVHLINSAESFWSFACSCTWLPGPFCFSNEERTLNNSLNQFKYKTNNKQKSVNW